MRKHFSKFVLAFACVFLAVAIAFCAYSFASYVSRVDKNENAGVAAIDCKVHVDGDLISFVNAPFIQTVGASPIRMNDWAKATVTLKNDGKHGIKYKYSLVFYMPEEFAECAMFQLLELDGSTEDEIAKASRIYRISDDGNGLTEADKTDEGDGGVAIENAYQSYIDENKELKIAADSHVEISGSEVATVKRSYAAYYVFGDSENSKAFVCPVSFAETEKLDYCRITVNLDVAENDYILNSGESHSYVFRLVPRKALGEDVSAAWDVNKYWITNGDGTLTCISEPISENSAYEYRWFVNDGGSPVLQARETFSASNDWFDVTVESNVGMTNPTRVSAVFTQSA